MEKKIISIENAKIQDVKEYKNKYGKKAIYKKNGREYVKPFISIKIKSGVNEPL